MCAWFSSSQFALYVNASRVGIEQRSISRLSGGGSLFLGQEQDRVGGSLDAIQAFAYVTHKFAYVTHKFAYATHKFVVNIMSRANLQVFDKLFPNED